MNRRITFKRLKDVCMIRPPKKESKELLNEDELVSFVPMEMLGTNQMFFSSKTSRSLKSVYSGYTYFRDGDVVLAKITPCFENGKLGIAQKLVNGVGFGSSEYVIYRPSSELDKKYLYYFLSNSAFREKGKRLMGGAVGHQRIPKEFYEDENIPIPPLTEQKQIVSFLDQAFAAIDQAKANIEKNIENAKELFQSKLNEIFSETALSGAVGWEEKTLKDITTKIGSGATPRGGQASYKESGISLIRSMNVHDEGFRDKKLAFIDDEQARKLNNVTVYENDVLLNITGASVARCCVVDKAYLPARVNQHVSIIRLKEGMMSHKFLHYALTSKETKTLLLGIGEQGATRQAITKSQIENFTIRFPSELYKQLELVNSLDLIKKQGLNLNDNYQKKLNDLEELKKSILQKAFTGELTVSNLDLKDLQIS